MTNNQNTSTTIDWIKLSCDSRFQRAFTACSCVFKVITLVWANQRKFIENATTCSKRMRKTLVATQLYYSSRCICFSRVTKFSQQWRHIVFAWTKRLISSDFRYMEGLQSRPWLPWRVCDQGCGWLEVYGRLQVPLGQA